ncbi:MAG: aminodeoxychorismate synthase component I [Campylobacterales bacterium]|nr:aminodeoxychorismate synthase component I [Campylobacterales bacterium]
MSGDYSKDVLTKCKGACVKIHQTHKGDCVLTCKEQNPSFEQTLNTYGAAKKPCFFMVSYDQTVWHIEPLATPSGVVWYALEGRGFAPPPPQKLTLPSQLTKKPIAFEAYEVMHARVQEEIRSGNTYLLNLTCKSVLETPLVLEHLFYASSAPFRCLLKDQFVCFSPERFVKIAQDEIHTFPMKGTIDASVQEASAQLLEDEKEKAEHVMVVDLLRNDLSRVALGVHVKRFRYLEEIEAGGKRLLQASSHICGALPKNWHETLGTLLKTLLPAGSITGTPKKKTVEIIEEVEGYARGYFTGIFGVYDGHGVDSAVMIRFVEKEGTGYVYKSGGGITLLSDAHKEYQEMVDKIYVPLL